MAKLILTQEEKAAATWLELDDAALGKLVKYTAARLKDTGDRSAEQAAVWWWSAALLMVGIAADCNAEVFVQMLHGYQRGGKTIGDFRIKVEKVCDCGTLDRDAAEVEGTGSQDETPLGNDLLSVAVSRGVLNSDDSQAMSLGHAVMERVLPEAMQFLFRRMRLLGIVPAFYAGTAHSEATGAPTGSYVPASALQNLADDLREQWGLSSDCIDAVVKGVAVNLIDVDRLPPDVAAAVAKGINQGYMTAQSSYQVM